MCGHQVDGGLRGPGSDVVWRRFGDFLFGTKNQRNSDCLESTLPATNIAPENGWLEDEFPFGRPNFRGYVSFREGKGLQTFFVRTQKSLRVFLFSVHGRIITAVSGSFQCNMSCITFLGCSMIIMI